MALKSCADGKELLSPRVIPQLDRREKMSIILENPKTFLPLLLFIGFIFVLLGSGIESSAFGNLVGSGFFLMLVAIALWVLNHRGSF